MCSGYTYCKCSDCMEIAVSNDTNDPNYCNDCEGVCGPDYATSTECQVEFDTYNGYDFRSGVRGKYVKDEG